MPIQLKRKGAELKKGKWRSKKGKCFDCGEAAGPTKIFWCDECWAELEREKEAYMNGETQGDK